MDQPTVINTLIDNEKNITYEVFAYRKLTREELVLAVRHFYAQKKKPRVKPGQTIKIITIIGHNE
jgi:hypothetical protein